MNVLIISSSRAFGGMENQTVNLVRALNKTGHHVVLGAPAGSVLYEKAREFAAPVEDISFTNACDFITALRMAQAIRRHKIDVLVATLGKEYWPAAVTAKILMGRKVVFMRHMADRLKRHTAWLVRQYVDKIIAVSDFVKQGLMETGIPPEKISVVHNGTDLDFFIRRDMQREQARTEFHFSPGDLVIGTAGALNEGKGLFVLLKAAHMLKNSLLEKLPQVRLKLLMVGEGPGRAELEEEAGRLDITAVMPGRRLDMERVYSAMDIFIFPSICRETFGMVVIEAMASGLPVIASSVGGVPEIVKDGENGLLAPPGNPTELAAAIEKIALDAEFSNKLILNGGKTVREKFSSEAMARRFEAVIASL